MVLLLSPSVNGVNGCHPSPTNRHPGAESCGAMMKG